jgi:hypothetical protein
MAGGHYNDEPRLRAELFSANQLEHHGVRLASAHRVTPNRLPDQLLSRLPANDDVLVQTCNRLALAVARSHRITPAREWLLDNFLSRGRTDTHSEAVAPRAPAWRRAGYRPYTRAVFDVYAVGSHTSRGGWS